MTQAITPVTHARVHDLLQRARGRSVAIVGDVMLDRYLMGDTERISPEAPVPVVMIEQEEVMAGGAANVAANVAAVGIAPRLVGSTGNDSEGASLRETLAALAISTDALIEVPGRPTTSKTRITARGQQIVRIDREVSNPIPDRYRDDLLQAAHAAITHADVLLIEDYDKGTIDAAMAGDLIAAARARKIPTIVDPKVRNFFAYAGATLFKPNRRELETAFTTHFMGDDADLEDARQRLGAEHLLVTLGADGMALVSAGGSVRRTQSIARQVFDVSGAGDTVAAWLAVVLAAQGSIAEAVWIANVAAGIEVGKRGTASVSPAELLDAVAREAV